MSPVSPVFNTVDSVRLPFFQKRLFVMFNMSMLAGRVSKFFSFISPLHKAKILRALMHDTDTSWNQFQTGTNCVKCYYIECLDHHLTLSYGKLLV